MCVYINTVLLPTSTPPRQQKNKNKTKLDYKKKQKKKESLTTHRIMKIETTKTAAENVSNWQSYNIIFLCSCNCNSYTVRQPEILLRLPKNYVIIAIFRQISLAIIVQTVHFSNLVRLDHDVCSTMYDVCAIAGWDVTIHVRISAIE